MGEIGEAFAIAFRLVASLDNELFEIVALSLKVSLIAVGLACLIGFVLAGLLAAARFPGRQMIVLLFNALMGLPPVVVGLVVYLLLSRSGPLGVLGLLYTPAAMIIAQAILVTPLITALSLQIIDGLHAEYDEFLRSLNMTPAAKMKTLLWDARFSLLTIALAGFGRAISEVGAVMIVGGNINHVTRIMTTAIALETSKGTLALALALGIILISISIAVNAGALAIRSRVQGQAHA